ncbi:MAG TPA: tRNA (adenosine(37)-N6)-dimethylallyltransferase MiaA [Longimicrobiales bacterium]
MADCLVITGATATGKTDVAIDVARRVAGEIISFDSRQIYQQMDIGTAKATPAQRALVPHYGLDLLPPSGRYNAGRFAEDARAWMQQIRARDHVPILVGGTGFFLRALTHPLFSEPESDPERKEALKQILNQKPRSELLAWLRHLDPEAAVQATEDVGRQRIARLLEVVLLTGRPLGWWQQHAQPTITPIRALTFVLDLDRTILYERINARVVQMVNNGLIDEVERLLAAGYDEHSPGMKTTGYIELIPFVRGQCSKEAAIDAIQRATRAYARRQITWFRHQLAEPVVRIDAAAGHADIVETIVRKWQQQHANRN